MDPLKEAHEQQLISLLTMGDERAFTEIYRRYLTGLFHSVLKMAKDEGAAQEITLDVFTKLWLKRESLSIDQSLQAYLYRIAQNMLLDRFRKIKRDEALYSQYKAIATSAYNPVEDRLNYLETEQELEKALDHLSQQQRKVFELCKLEGNSYKETAQKLGISPHTVKEYLSKACKTVKEYLLNHQIQLIIAVFLFFC